MKKKAAAKSDKQEDLSGVERGHTRFRTIFAGSVQVEGRSRNCIIMDLSESGAKLKDVEDLKPGMHLDLVINRLGPYHPLRCQIMWQREAQYGVKFTGDPEEIRETMSKLFPSRWSYRKI